MSCAIEILSFQNFYKVLKTGSAGRKDFFDTLSPCVHSTQGLFDGIEHVGRSDQLFKIEEGLRGHDRTGRGVSLRTPLKILSKKPTGRGQQSSPGSACRKNFFAPLSKFPELYKSSGNLGF